jgi:hypothetical protein
MESLDEDDEPESSFLSVYEYVLSHAGRSLVVEANPLVAPSSRINDARDSRGVLVPSRVNAKFVEYTFLGRAPQTSSPPLPMVLIALQTTKRVPAGAELLTDYTQGYWDAMKANEPARRRFLAGRWGSGGKYSRQQH